MHTENAQTLYLIRGLPRSGKMEFANTLYNLYADEGQLLFIESAQSWFDQYANKEGDLEFDSNFLGVAHDYCYSQVMGALRRGINVAVANTFSTRRELDRYTNGLKRTGLDKDVNVHVIRIRPVALPKIPQKTLENILSRWEDYPGEQTFTP